MYLSYLDNLKRNRFNTNLGNIAHETIHKIHKMVNEDALEEGANLDAEFEFLNEQELPKAVIGIEDKRQLKIFNCNSSFSSCLGYQKNQLLK